MKKGNLISRNIKNIYINKGATGDKGVLGDIGPTGDTGMNIPLRKNNLLIFKILMCNYIRCYGR